MSEFKYFIDEFLYFRERLFVAGWAFHSSFSIQSVEIVLEESALQTFQKCQLPSIDVEQQHYGITTAKDCRFICQAIINSAEDAQKAKLLFKLTNGQQIEISNPVNIRIASDPYHALQLKFSQELNKIPEGNVLELGSRARSGNIMRNALVPKHLHYTGVDILAGENVDVVGDAHSLSQLFPPNSFDALYCISVFEHLIMPWKVVLEMNRILKIGGVVMITTHQTWPMHDTPWDFWRFSDQAWRGLFNEYTGFTILETALGLPASIVSYQLQPSTMHLELQPAFLGSAVLCRKVAHTNLTWEVDAQKISTDMYPA